MTEFKMKTADLDKYFYEDFTTRPLQAIQKELDCANIHYRDDMGPVERIKAIQHAVMHITRHIGDLTEPALDFEHGLDPVGLEMDLSIATIRAETLPGILLNLLRVANMLNVDLGSSYVQYLREMLEADAKAEKDAERGDRENVATE